MRRSLMIVLTLGLLAFLANDATARSILLVPLTKTQVATVCDGKTVCVKSCGLNGQDTCVFGCGRNSCSGSCMTCSSRTNVHAVHTVVNAGTARGPSR